MQALVLAIVFFVIPIILMFFFLYIIAMCWVLTRSFVWEVILSFVIAIEFYGMLFGDFYEFTKFITTVVVVGMIAVILINHMLQSSFKMKYIPLFDLSIALFLFAPSVQRAINEMEQRLLTENYTDFVREGTLRDIETFRTGIPLFLILGVVVLGIFLFLNAKKAKNETTSV